MRCRYVVFFMLTFCLNTGFWYYIIAFCAVYVTTSLAWVYSGILNIIIGYGVVQFLDPLTKTIVRSLALRYRCLL
jgi:hypothetical protein